VRKDDMVDEVLDAVMHHYKLKSTIEKKNIENYYKFNLADISFQKNKHPDLPNGVIADSALVKKNWEHRKEIINQHKEKYNKILSQ